MMETLETLYETILNLGFLQNLKKKNSVKNNLLFNFERIMKSKLVSFHISKENDSF